MKPVAGNIEIERTPFNKWLYLFFTAASVFAFFISVNKEGNVKWICLGGVVMFGAAWWLAIKSRITTYQNGFTIRDGLKSKEVLWNDITSLIYDVHYHGHGVQLTLTIQYDHPAKSIMLPVKQYKKQPMQRFFEMLDEQCILAVKNGHFIKQATGTMDWKDKLKMYGEQSSPFHCVSVAC